MRVLGLMSGTSADGIDAALVDWPDAPGARPFELVAFRESGLEPALQERIHRLAAGELPGVSVLRELSALDVEIGEQFAAAALSLLEAAGVDASSVDAIASHGQTVAHHPEHRASLQIGDPSVIAERTGIATLADFRARDLAAGGEGAPLAPLFHHEAMGDPDESRLVLNLGGMANVTWLPRGGDPDAVVAFDVGPANALLDGVMVEISRGDERLDRDGARAAAGSVDEALLAELLDDEFLRRAPPKSTGRERYGSAEAAALAKRFLAADRAPDDLLATLVAFTAESVAEAVRRFLAAPDRVLVGGGGVKNPTLMAALRERLGGVPVLPFDAVGVPADAAEAMAFSLMGRNAMLGIPNHLPRCTGARRATVLGEWAAPGTGRPLPRQSS
ncbi:MAG: anhydro-N-acetylmuramic acid kinase [Myxococcota bacterium]|nr:anhydro-N-acetylmuramic acid kinase [Myxococcota bacterium]